MPKPPLPEEYKFGTYGSMVAVKMMEKDMPTPMTIEMEAEDIRAALDQINLYIGYTAGHVDDEKYRATWKAFIKVHSALLTKTHENVTCENLSDADERQAALDIVNEQAKDDGLWFVAKYASEAYLQQELRRLHRSIELAALQSPRVPEPTSIENVAMEDTWLREKIGIALGEASMCWSETPKGVFHSERATEILNDLCCQIDTRKSPRVPDDAKYHELCKQCWDALGITEYTGKHIAEHIKELRSPRVPVIDGLDEAMSVINKFIRARDAEIDFLPEKSTKNTSEWISHFMHNVNYSLSFNDWMNLDKARAYAELQKGV